MSKQAASTSRQQSHMTRLAGHNEAHDSSKEPKPQAVGHVVAKVACAGAWVGSNGQSKSEKWAGSSKARPAVQGEQAVRVMRAEVDSVDRPLRCACGDWWTVDNTNGLRRERRCVIAAAARELTSVSRKRPAPAPLTKADKGHQLGWGAADCR